jgi:hypothetical protein
MKILILLFVGATAFSIGKFTGVGFDNHTGGPLQVTVRCFSESHPKVHQFVLADGQEDSFKLACPK